jgi:15-cis-phytoene synthase
MQVNAALAPFSIHQHSKSFAGASGLLQTDTAKHAKQLYALCRAIDDLVDRSHDQHRAEHELANLQTAIEENRPHDWLTDFRQLPGKPAQQSRYLLRLINAVKTDLKVVRIQDETQLLEYAYGVAGSVGLLMTPLLCEQVPVADLGNNQQACPHASARLAATALGMAMQLSNIARDVVEDAKIDRLYLPQSWFFEAPNIRGLAAADPRELRKCVPALVRLLALSEVLYRVAESGMGYIAAPNRLAILVAKNFYRQIGREINQGIAQLAFAKRVRVAGWKKLGLAFAAAWEHCQIGLSMIGQRGKARYQAADSTRHHASAKAHLHQPTLSTSAPLLTNIEQLIQRDDLTCPVPSHVLL